MRLVLGKENMAQKREKKDKKRKWVCYESKHSNSLRIADWKMLRDAMWFLCCLDDALGFVVGHGEFEDATANALLVLDETIRNYGKPASIMTAHGSRFSNTANGASEFEKRLAEPNMRQILSGVRYSNQRQS